MKGRSAASVTSLALALAFTASACGEPISDKYVIENEPFTLEDIAGSDLKKVTLTPKATERLGITTSQVSANGDSLEVPSSALWLDIEGVFWVYMNPEPNVFLRHAVVVEDDDGSRAVLSEGPPGGTTVVTAGVPELFGTEVGVGK